MVGNPALFHDDINIFSVMLGTEGSAFLCLFRGPFFPLRQVPDDCLGRLDSPKVEF